jgi:transposase
MPRYKPYDYKQSKLVVLDYEAQLQPSTFEHALHHLIDKKLDLSIFDVRFKNDDAGRPAYDPAILLKIILFAYSKGITSSREIQWYCRHNILFQALSCDTVPHWSTIAHFVSSHPDEIEELFEQVLLVCDEQGLLGKELFAINGCKLPSNVAKEWSGTFKELSDKQKKVQQRIRVLIGEHRRIDEEEAATGDAARTERTDRTLETLNRASEKIERFFKERPATDGPGQADQGRGANTRS